MTTFSDAIDNQSARTENGMLARQSTANASVDLFFKIGASRGKNIVPDFVKAFVENTDYAIRIAQWARDVRGGAGERQLFKDILGYLEKSDPDLAMSLINKIPEVGRWDDMLIEYENKAVESHAFGLYETAIRVKKDGLAAKWAPRKGVMARKMREAWDMSPKQYRKTLVALTKVVETQMCNKDWTEIEFGKVPSVAHARYKGAFYKNAGDVYEAYVNRLVNKDETEVKEKINAGAVYPYDVLKGIINQYSYWRNQTMSQTEKNVAMAQWDELPNYMGDANILPMVDVSGSMTAGVAGSDSLTCLDVAVSLGLYCADKNKGKFNGTFLTFSGNPTLVNLKGNILQKVEQMVKANWEMNTNLHRAFEKVLSTAVQNKVPASEMPEMIVIFSDMQFDRCTRFDDSAIKMIERKYTEAGYEVPKVVFWNLRVTDNSPVKFDQTGTALVSGFSPTVMKSLLAGNLEKFTPESIMLETIMKDRYDY